MGIPRFFRFLQESYPDIVSTTLIEKITSLWIDANAKVYTACDRVYGFSDLRDIDKALEKNKQAHENQQDSYKMCILETKNVLVELVEKVKPEETVGIMFDGIIPVAKLYQTRERRYRASLENSDKKPKDDKKEKDEFQIKKSQLIPYQRMMITPGTKFMFDLDFNLMNFVKTDTTVLPPRKIYSSYKSENVGEGEHKIFTYLEKYYSENKSSDVKYHVIHGLDADLILLSLLSKIPGIILMRHDYGNYVMIDRLRQHIVEDMQPPKLPSVPEHILIQDFCIIMAMVGNDFVKPLVIFDDLESSIPVLVEAYHNLGKQLSMDNGNVNFGNFQEYCIQLSKLEKKAVVEHLIKNVDVEGKYRSVPAYWVIDDIIAGLSKKEQDNIQLIKDYITKNEDNVFKEFRRWYNINAVIGYSYEDMERLGFKLDDLISIKNTDMRNFCYRYLQMIQWNIYYYIHHNKASNSIGFNYHYSPLITDLVDYMNSTSSHKNMKPEVLLPKEQKWHGLLTQALSVIPKTKYDILPRPLWKFYDYDPIMSEFPVKFEVDYFGVKDNIHSRVITNFPNIEKLSKAVENNKITTNVNIYNLVEDYVSRVDNLELAIENRVKDINLKKKQEYLKQTMARTYKKKEETEGVVRVDMSKTVRSARGRGGRGGPRGGVRKQRV